MGIIYPRRALRRMHIKQPQMSYRYKIAVNTRLLIKDKMDGIGYFTYETMRRIVQWNPDIAFHFLFDRTPDEMFLFGPNVVPVTLHPQARHPFLWYLWFEWSVAGYLRQHDFDLFLSPDGYCSLGSGTPTVAVMHDIAYEHYPQYVPYLVRAYYKYFMPRYAAHASRIATVSEYSKTDIVRYYSTDPAKIDIVYSAAKSIFQPDTEAEIAATRAQYAGGHPYLIFVGSIHPRKNLKNMLLGFELHRSSSPDSRLKFIVAGAFGWQNSELKQVIESMRYRNEVIFLGRQSESDLARLIAGAFALMYVSVFEGFGVPPLEAMQSHVPAISSTTSSLPEIGGDAALYADPHNPQSISDAISHLWEEPSRRAAMIERGISRASIFTWDRTATLLWRCCEKVLSKK